MSIGHNSGLAVVEARGWTQILGSYRKPNHARSIAELAITFLPLAMLWTAAWFTFSLGYAWAPLLIAIPAAGFLVRLFMIQHDCGHGTFFANRQANDWIWRFEPKSSAFGGKADIGKQFIGVFEGSCRRC